MVSGERPERSPSGRAAALGTLRVTRDMGVKAEILKVEMLGQVDESGVKIHRAAIGEAIGPVGTQQGWRGGEAKKLCSFQQLRRHVLELAAFVHSAQLDLADETWRQIEWGLHWGSFTGLLGCFKSGRREDSGQDAPQTACGETPQPRWRSPWWR
jgi:hypothetical protein